MAQPNIYMRVVMFVVWLALVVLCGLAYFGKLGKNSLADVAGENETALTPKGYTYYSLAIIAAIEGFGCVYALLPWGYEGPKKDRWKAKTVNAVGPWWILGFICQMLWLILWVQDLGATYILAFSVQIAGFTSFAICYGILMGMTSKHGKKSGLSVSPLSYISLYIPTIMNLAWLTIASCIGFFTVLQHFHPGNSHSDQAVAVLLAAAVTFAGLLVEGFHVSVFFGLTLIWTFIGIYTKKKAKDVSDKDFEIMEQALLVCLILLAQMTLWSIVVSIFRFFKQADDKEIPLTSSSSDEEEEGQVASSEKPIMV